MSSYPFARYFIPFLIGILTSAFWCENAIIPIVFSFSFLVLSLVVTIVSSPEIRFKINTLRGFLLFAGILLFGAAVNTWHNQRWKKSTDAEQSGIYRLRIDDNWQQKGNYSFTICSVHQKLNGENWEFSRKRARMYSRLPDYKLPGMGQIILYKGALNEISSPKNPFDVNYKKLSERKRIHFSISLDSCNFKPENKNETSIKEFAVGIRGKLAQKLQSTLNDSLAFGIVSALVLGSRSDLDQEILQAFSATGTIHVLSVSGMHVGLVYFAIGFLLRLLPKGRITLNLSTTIFIISLWMYALITGFSPSVLRAVTMLSLIILGNAANMRPNIYNTLSAAAFLLLCLDPQLIFHAGFQLSFLAVLGIVVVHPLIYPLVYVRNKWLDKIWVLSSVSLSAQLSTFPLAVYHFGVFPNYFLIANLMIIPLATGVLFLGISTLITIEIPGIGDCFGQLLKWNVNLLTTITKWFSELPGSVSYFHFSAAECVLVYVAIFCLIVFLHSQKWPWVRAALLFVGCAMILRFIVWNIQVHFSTFTIASLKNGISVTINDQKIHHSFCIINEKTKLHKNNDAITKESIRFNSTFPTFIIVNHYQLNTVVIKTPLFLFEKGVLHYKNKRIALVSSRRKFQKKLNVDILLVSGLFPFASIKDLENFSPQLIIMDENCSTKRIEKWKKLATEKMIPFYNIKEKGAYRIYLPLFFL
ncbi:MAG: ComEC/Rec2 family competence protein [Flavobacteriales bacterium]